MKLFQKASDGGKDSGVTAWFLIEWKPVFSVALLRFSRGTREAFHTHAFNALTLWLKGKVRERHLNGEAYIWHPGDFKYTSRKDFHQVEGITDATWALTIRGPWLDFWREFRDNNLVTLTHGRKIVSKTPAYRMHPALGAPYNLKESA